MKEGLVSVIIPCYNNAPYIRKCVESVLSQTYQNFEIIIVDDGSNDHPEKQLEDIKDSRLKPIIRTKNQGVSTARNIGIEAAVGEFIIFIDGDDWVEPNHIELLTKGLTEAGSCITFIVIDDDKSSQIEASRYSFVKENPIVEDSKFSYLLSLNILSSPCNKLYKTSLLKEANYLRFDTSITYAEDLIFNLEYFKNIKSIKLESKITYHYVKRPSSSTPRFHNFMVYTLERLTDCIINFCKELNDDGYIFLMRQYLWGIHNIFNPQSKLSKNQKKAAISSILAIPYFKYALRVIGNLELNKSYATLLKLNNSNLLFTFLTKRFSK